MSSFQIQKLIQIQLQLTQTVILHEMGTKN